ncbi:PREDICTED: prorelaxin H2-like [Condylura cristata]|uniref:prorelaxin H2-like n=1 Tax=Condylura cristata TaxID=143302 RepID=UPI0003347619|nr:PREDICTED: prorelaxin H2-like [Condylura cristata]
MQTQLLYHLLAVCLLLIQLSDNVHGNDLDEVVKACGRDYVRLHIEACGNPIPSRNRKERPQRNRSKTNKKKSSTKNKETGLQTAKEPGFVSLESLKSLLAASQFSRKAIQPALRSTILNSAKLQIVNHEDPSNKNSPAELNHPILDKHSREKRQVPVAMASKCCFRGCTRRELAKIC